MQRSRIAFGLGPVLSAVLGLIIVPTVAWNYSPDDVGRYGLLLVALQLSTIASTLGLDQAYVRWFHETSHKRRLYRNCFRPTLIAAIVMLSVALAVQACTSIGISGLSGAGSAALAGATLLSILTRMLSLPHRMWGRGWQYSAGQIGPKIVLLVLLISIPGEASFTKLSILLALSLFAGVVLYGVGLHRDDQEEPEAARAANSDFGMHSLYRYALPLVPATLIFWLLTAIGPISLSQLSTLSDVGVYAIVINFAGVASVMQTTFATLWAPTLFLWVSSGADLTKIDSMARGILGTSISAVCLAGLSAPAILLVLPPEYNAVAFYLPVAFIPPLLLMLSEVTGAGIYVKRRTTWALLPPTIAVAVAVLMAILLVPPHGVAGALVANLGGYFAFFLVRTEISNRIFRPVPRTRMYGAVATLCCIAATVALSNSFTYTGSSILWLIAGLITLPMTLPTITTTFRSLAFRVPNQQGTVQ